MPTPEMPKLPTVTIDGKTIPATAIRIVDNRLYLHARRTFEVLGYQVDWDEQTKAVTIRKGDG